MKKQMGEHEINMCIQEEGLKKIQPKDCVCSADPSS